MVLNWQLASPQPMHPFCKGIGSDATQIWIYLIEYPDMAEFAVATVGAVAIISAPAPAIISSSHAPTLRQHTWLKNDKLAFGLEPMGMCLRILECTFYGATQRKLHQRGELSPWPFS